MALVLMYDFLLVDDLCPRFSSMTVEHTSTLAKVTFTCELLGQDACA